MKKTWENDSCETVQACYAVYHVSVAAALWCGVPAANVEEELSLAVPISQANALSRATLRHPYLKCLEPRIRAIHAAIDDGKLKSCREDGRKTDEHVAYERRHVYGLDLKEWAKEISPTERPTFLFDEIESNAHSAITVDSYQALKAAHDAKELQLALANTRIRELNEKIGQYEPELAGLRAMADKIGQQPTPLGDRSEKAYLNIIGAMLDLMLGVNSIGKPNSIYGNQEAVVTALIEKHDKKYGISKSNLSSKFPEAKRTLAAEKTN